MKRNSSDKRVLHCWLFNWDKQKEFSKNHPTYKTFHWWPKFAYCKFGAIPCAWDGGPYFDEYHFEVLWLYTGFAIRYGEKN